MIDRFEQPDCPPETPQQREAEQFSWYQIRKAAERMNQEKLEKAAKKAAETGDRRDLQEYLRLRRILL